MAPFFLAPDHDELLVLPVVVESAPDHRESGDPVCCDRCGHPLPIEQLRLVGTRWLCVARCAVLNLVA